MGLGDDGECFLDGFVMPAKISPCVGALQAPPPPPTATPPRSKFRFSAFPRTPLPIADRPTPETLFRAHVQRLQAPGRIAFLRSLSQDGSDPRWAQEKVNPQLILLSSTKFASCSTLRGNRPDTAGMLRRVVWQEEVPSSHAMDHGVRHERSGVELAVKALEAGLVPLGPQDVPLPRDGAPQLSSPFVDLVNHEVQTTWSSNPDRPFHVCEKIHEHGINVHVGNFAMSTSYDAVLRVVDARPANGSDGVGNTDAWVLVEVKCPTAAIYSNISHQYECQMLGSMGVLRAQGLDVGMALLVVWTRARTRIFLYPFSPLLYAQLEAAVLRTYFTRLLPALAARDSGLLKPGELVPADMGLCVEGEDSDGGRAEAAPSPAAGLSMSGANAADDAGVDMPAVDIDADVTRSTRKKKHRHRPREADKTSPGASPPPKRVVGRPSPS
jgi:hypothetical protein